MSIKEEACNRELFGIVINESNNKKMSSCNSQEILSMHRYYMYLCQKLSSYSVKMFIMPKHNISNAKKTWILFSFILEVKHFFVQCEIFR